MKRVNRKEALELAQKVIVSARNADQPWSVVRHELEKAGWTPATQILAEAWPIACKLAKWSYNPADFGADCKHKEVVKRLRLKSMAGICWTTWGEFFAHKAGEADFYRNGQRIEHKGGCGDFNHCRYGSIEKMRREYERKNELLEWDYPSAGIYVICTWAEFFTRLEAYGKGLDTWYREIRETSKGYIFTLQSVKNSKPKLTWLQTWELNQYRHE